MPYNLTQNEDRIKDGVEMEALAVMCLPQMKTTDLLELV
jgi:hypothetical protein